MNEEYHHHDCGSHRDDTRADWRRYLVCANIVTKPILTTYDLLRAGFSAAGCWEIGETSNLINRTRPPLEPGVYAFAVDGIVRYVGLASKSLHRRLYSYSRPGASQRTNIRMNATILDFLKSGGSVEVFIAHPPDGEWNGLRTKGAEGLEAGLIEQFDLPWNVRGTAAPPKAGEVTMRNSGERQTNVRSRILEQIRKRPGMTELELAKFIYGPSAQQPQANTHCRKLVSDGLVERRGSGGGADPFVYYPKR